MRNKKFTKATQASHASFNFSPDSLPNSLMGMETHNPFGDIRRRNRQHCTQGIG